MRRIKRRGEIRKNKKKQEKKREKQKNKGGKTEKWGNLGHMWINLKSTLQIHRIK
jgi:hypothetical protein